MAQELGITEKDSDFQNPFKIDRAEVSCWGLQLFALCLMGMGGWVCRSYILGKAVGALNLEPDNPRVWIQKPFLKSLFLPKCVP